MTDTERGDPPDEGGHVGEGNGALTDVTLDVRDVTAVVDDYAAALLDAGGRVATWNEAAGRITEYDEDEIVGTHYRVLFSDGDREAGRPERLLERARGEGRAEDRGWRVRGDGGRFWAREVLVPIGDGDFEVDALEAEGGEESEDGDGEGTGETEDAERNDDANDEGANGEADGILGYGWFVHDRTDDHERQQELRAEKAFTESVLDAQPDILYAYDADGELREWNDQFEAVTGYDAADLAGMDPLAVVAPEERSRLDAAIDRVLEEGDRVTAEGHVLTKAGERIPYEFNSARITDEDGNVLGFTGIGRDVSDRKARERELERLERLNRIVRGIDEEIVAAESREGIEAAVVEGFAAADHYRFAAIGRTESARELPSLEAAAGEGLASGAASTDLENLLGSFVAPPADAPGGSPLAEGRVQQYAYLGESGIETWRTDARERGYGAVAIVPLVAGDRELGVLLIAAVEQTPFTDRELRVLEEFGSTVGHAVDAMTLRRLLYMDTVVELEFESTDRGDVCVDLSRRADCRLTLDHVLPLTDEVFVYYVTASDVDPERIREALAAHPSIRDVRAIDVDGTESHWEFVVAEEPIAGLLAEYGGRIRSKVVDHGVSTDLVQVSPDANVRELVDAVTAIYPDATLVSKHTVDQPVQTRGDFRREVEELLTDRQRTALESAYYGGYFEWPRRRSDAGDLADQLGIARQTLHQHLRVAQQKLLTVYLEGGP